MKKFKIVANILTLSILVGGLVPCIVSYIGHSLQCHGCSMHNGHPAIEIMIYGLVVLFSVVVFAVSRLILRLYDKKSADGLKDRSQKTKSEKRFDIIVLVVLTAGFVHYVVQIICEFTSFSFLTLLSTMVFIIPYVWIATVVFVISRVIFVNDERFPELMEKKMSYKWHGAMVKLKNNNENSFVSREKFIKAKAEKIVYILALTILLAGFLHYICMLVKEWPSFSYSNSVFYALAFESIYMLPYVFLAAVILVINRLMLLKKHIE